MFFEMSGKDNLERKVLEWKDKIEEEPLSLFQGTLQVRYK
jgi:hypothetical protein